MKKLIILLISLQFISCSKTDKINHYLNKPVTEAELVKNGFYKYSFTRIVDDEDDIMGKVGTVLKYVLYSNVKPQKGVDGKSYPIPFFTNSDNSKENIDYVVNDLNDRIISYFFINDTLNYKSIFVYSINKKGKSIADFRTKENIIKYYDSLKIPIIPIMEGKRSTEKYTTLFMINNYKTQIYYSTKKNEIAYDMLTNYGKDNMPFGDIMKQWYNGYNYELSK